MVLERNKNGSHVHVVVFVTPLQPISLRFSNVNKRSKFHGFIFLAEVCFHGIQISRIDEKSAKFEKIRSYGNFMPHDGTLLASASFTAV